LLSHEGGSISSVSYGLAHSLSKNKIETTIFSTTVHPTISYQKINDYLDIVRLPIVDTPPRALWFSLRNSNLLLKLLRDYAIVHAVSPEILITYTSFRKRSNKPIISTIHGSYKAALKAFIKSPLNYWTPGDFALHVLEFPLHEMVFRRCFSESSKVVVCSYKTLRELENYDRINASKVSVIYNGINFNEIQRIECKKNERDSEEFTLIYAGRLYWMKGITFVLKAYENLKGEFKNLRLKIFGKGPLKTKIQKFITDGKFDDSIYFGGFLPHNELIKEIKGSNAVIFPSLYESQPMFVLEAMACKKPIVAFDLPYAREIIKDGETGLLAKPYDTVDLVRLIAKMITDNQLSFKISENAQEYVEKNHNWDAQAKKYLELYYEVAALDRK
jgi:glycosyltransferase involved in cell wall biosynthesis